MSDLRENVKEVIRHGLCSKYPVWHSPGQHTEAYIKNKVAVSQLTTTPLLPPTEVSAAQLRGRSSFYQVCIKFPLSSSSSSPPSSASSHPLFVFHVSLAASSPSSIPPFSPSLISLMVSMDVKDHVYLLFQLTTTPLLTPTEVSAALARG